MRRALLFWLIVLAIPSGAATPVCAQDQAGLETVAVSGESPIYEGNVAQAKERALQEAFSAAITQVMGAFVTAESYTQNFVSIDRSVLSKTKGYVQTYEILEIRQETDSLALKAKVVVSRSSIKDDLTALGILLDAMGNPLVQIQARDEELDAPESEGVFKCALNAKGFHVLDRVENDEPDIILEVKGKINNQSRFGDTGLFGAVVSMEAKAIQQSTKKLIASKETVANGAGLSDSAARKEAYRKAAEDLAPQLIAALIEKWSRELTSGSSIQLIAKVSDYAKAQQFSKELAHLFGIKKIDLRSFQNGEAHYLVRFAGQIKTLADLLTRIPADKCSVSIERLDASVVQVAVHFR